MLWFQIYPLLSFQMDFFFSDYQHILLSKMANSDKVQIQIWSRALSCDLFIS